MIPRPLLPALLATTLAVAQPPDKAPEAAAGEPLYSLHADRQDLEVTLRDFAKAVKVPLSIPELPTQTVSIHFKNLPFEKALRQILAAGHLDCRQVDDGYVVGLPLDLKLRFPQPDEKNLDATYRCRRVGADSLANAIRQVLPELNVTTGPVVLSPALEGGATTGGGEQLKTIGASDVSFRTHDVLFSGPAESVRRALNIAQKFDRPRKQVKITIKVVELDTTASSDLGIQWMSSLNFSAAEQVTPGSGTAPAAGSLVDGIRLGRFGHSPLVVNATLNAMESKGHSKTLSKPTLTLLDGERSFILSGQRYLYPKYTGKDQQGQSIYDVAEAKIGVYLQVGVQVGLDGDMILTLYPQITSLGQSRIINGAEYPSINTSEEQTTVRAGNGEMLVLGGLLSDATTFNRSGVPFLSSIPLLGRLFSTDSKDKIKNELMLILTPELVDEVLPKDEVTISVSDPGRS